MNARAVLVVGVVLASVACGQSEGTAAPAPAPHPDGGDPNATFETAHPIEVDSPGVFDFVDGREDADYFSFEGKRGQWLEIRSGSLDPITFADTRLTLFDGKRVQLAYNRYVKSLVGENVLARIVTRLPNDGKYFVEVGDPEGPPVAAGLSQAYRLTVSDLTTKADGFAVEAEGSNDAAPVIFHEWPIDAATIDDSFLVGSFSDAAHVDRFSFSIAGNDLETLSLEVSESGDQADGSTATPGKVWITDTSGTDVIARIDNTVGQAFLAPPLTQGNYVLSVSHPESPVGQNDFYVLRALVGPENPIESSEASNDVIATAEPLKTIVSGGTTEAFLLAHVLDQDIDYFRFDGTVAQTASVYCESAEDGSGVVGLAVSARNESDQTLLEGTETRSSSDVPGSTVALENISMPAAGSLYIRVTKGGQLSDVTGDWARCAVYAQ